MNFYKVFFLVRHYNNNVLCDSFSRCVNCLAGDENEAISISYGAMCKEYENRRGEWFFCVQHCRLVFTNYKICR